MIPQRIFAALLLIAGTTASYIPAYTIDIARRQSDTSNTSKTNGLDSTPEFNNAASAACLSALSNMPGEPESASGVSLCYNVPFLDNSTGVFRASLKLYKVAEPRGRWANITLSDIVPSVAWSSASMIQNPRRQNDSPSDGDSSTDAPKSGPELVESLEWIGRIDADVMNKPMNLTSLQDALLPIVSLSAASLNASRLSTAEASFLIGTLSSKPRNKPPFILPGTKIEIFPIGAIITGSWALLFVSAIGWGTVGKVGFREHYRRRIARDRAAMEKRLRI